MKRKIIFNALTIYRIVQSHQGGAVFLNIRLLASFHSTNRTTWPSSYQKFSFQFCTKGSNELTNYDSTLRTKKREIQLVEELRCCYEWSIEEVRSMIDKCPDLVPIPPSIASRNAIYLKQCGVSKESFLNYPWILTFIEESILSHKLNCAKKLHSDVNVTLPLLNLSLSKLKVLSRNAEIESDLIPGGNRISFISNCLKCKPQEVSRVLASHPFVLKLPFERLETILKLLKDAGVSSQAILNDMWVFRHNILKIEERLHRAQEAGFKTIKPWVVRCPEGTFQRTVQRHVSSRESLGKHSSVVSYLCQRLECSPETIEYLSQKTPQILKVYVPKLKEVLDFLFEQGFTPEQICQVPRIFTHSLETLQFRMTHLKNLGHSPNSLIVLCKSKREFAMLIGKLSKAKRNYVTHKS